MPELAYTRTGAGPPLLILHGLFGSGKNWQSVARRVGEAFDVISVDLRNHGQSFHADEMSYPAMATDVAALLDALAIDRYRLLGHSMGGKVAMTLAYAQPDRIAGLVVADIAPVAYRHHYDDLIDPLLALPLDRLGSRADIDQALRSHIPEDQLRAFMLQSLAREPGGWRWRVNFPVIQREMDNLTGFTDLPASWRVDCPTLFIRGARSDYVGDAELVAIDEHFSDYRLATIADAGHWLHAERPAVFGDELIAFLRENIS